MPQIVCPVITCQSPNDITAERCSSCGIPLQEYSSLLFFQNLLFNAGMEALKSGRYHKARDLFLGVILWCPYDRDAKNGLALASFHLGWYQEAELYWNDILVQDSDNPIARRGMETIPGRNTRG